MIGGSGQPLVQNWGATGDRSAVVSGRAFDPRIMARLWAYLRPYKRKVFSTVCLTVVSAGVQIVGPYILKDAIDNYIVAGTDFVGLSRDSLLFGLSLLISYFSQANSQWTMAYVTQHALNKMRSELFEKINKLQLGYHDIHESGVTMSRIVNDVTVFQQLLTQGAVNAVADCLVIVGIIGFMLAMNAKLALYTLSVMPIMIIATTIFTALARKAYLRTRETIGEVAAGFQENVSGVRVVQAFAREDVNQNRFQEVNRDNSNANIWAI